MYKVKVGSHRVDIEGLVIGREYNLKPVNIEAIDLAVEYIYEHTKLTSKYKTPESFLAPWTSYGWKHVVEKSIGMYLSNGEFIIAAHIAGVTQRRDKGCNINTQLKLS